MILELRKDEEKVKGHRDHQTDLDVCSGRIGSCTSYRMLPEVVSQKFLNFNECDTS